MPVSQEVFPPLPPDLVFPRLPATEEAVRFSFECKKDALGAHIVARWGWDEEFQLQVHARRYAEKPFFSITRGDTALGTLSWLVREDHIRFGEFYLLSPYRNLGLGTRILRHGLAEADRLRRPVRLEYLRWNPVGALYRRHGFHEVRATDTHFHLERPVPTP